MKKICLVLGAALLVACSAKEPSISLGGDRDNHGCRGSAGYTWSHTRQACLRLWEDGITLVPVNPEGAALVAFAVESGNYARMEIFLPGKPKPFVLQQTGDDHDDWTSPVSDWKLRNTGKTWELLEKNTLRYKSKETKTN